MPPDGLQGRRLRILNELFRSPKGYTKQELIDIVGSRIKDYRIQSEKIKDGKGISKRSIDGDIALMKAEYGAPIKPIQGKYRYTNPNFSIEGSLLDPDEIANIRVAAALIKNIPGFELYESLKDIIKKLEMHAGVEENEQQIIQFDTRLGYSGNKHLTYLYEAISFEQVIAFKYKDFHELESREIILHPYLLKEFNNRWSLIGMTDDSLKSREYKISRFGLERIEGSIKPVGNIQYYRYYKFDPSSYLKDIIGVSLNEGDNIENVVLKFSAKRAPYVATNPLHHSQTLVEGTETTYSFQVIPNKELEALILFFGPDVEVLQPDPLRRKIVSLIKAGSKKYF